MKDNLEKFIRENREDFDKGVPNLKVWADIEKKMNPQKAKRRNLWINFRSIAAAAAILVFGISIGWLVSNQQQNTIASIEEQYPELVDMENFFKKEIKDKVAQLASYDYDPSLNNDLAELDGLLNELKIDLQDVPDGKKEQLIEAMIANYKTRMDILERVLHRLKSTKTKQLKFDKNDSIDI